MARTLTSLDARRLAAGVLALAVLVYWRSLANDFAWDDGPLVENNPLVHHASGLWRAFLMPYWPPPKGGFLYRPIVVASYTLDWLIAPWRAWWLHGVNIAWHAAVSVAVALWARRWAGDAAGWIAGGVFAVHPVHVEAVANVIGRAELLAALFALGAVWLAVERDALWGSTLAWTAALLCKENAIVVPGLIAAAWALGVPQPLPSPRRMRLYAGVWCGVALAYFVVRQLVFQPYPVMAGTAIVFLNQSPVTVRLTALAALSDIVRLLLFPVHLRVDYSPNERTAVTSFASLSLWVGIACLLAWAALFWVMWRRGRRVEAFGVAWVGIAFAPVANLLFPSGVLVAERTLYLPSVGLALALGAAVAGWRETAGVALRRVADTALALGVALLGIRAALRVPVWQSSETVYQSIVRDSPRSYFGPMIAGVYAQSDGRYEDALAAYRRAAAILSSDNRIKLRAAEMAYRLHRPAVADTFVAQAESTCVNCETFFRAAALEARWRGQGAFADSLLSHLTTLLAARRR